MGDVLLVAGTGLPGDDAADEVRQAVEGALFTGYVLALGDLGGAEVGDLFGVGPYADEVQHQFGG
jgi:hypothetical protein